jgi:hypothetical protein
MVFGTSQTSVSHAPTDTSGPEVQAPEALEAFEQTVDVKLTPFLEYQMHTCTIRFPSKTLPAALALPW